MNTVKNNMKRMNENKKSHEVEVRVESGEWWWDEIVETEEPREKPKNPTLRTTIPSLVTSTVELGTPGGTDERCNWPLVPWDDRERRQCQQFGVRSIAKCARTQFVFNCWSVNREWNSSLNYNYTLNYHLTSSTVYTLCNVETEPNAINAESPVIL